MMRANETRLFAPTVVKGLLIEKIITSAKYELAAQADGAIRAKALAGALNSYY
jgi:hypothetical protein